VASPDGRRVIRVSGEADDPIFLGTALARQALAEGASILVWPGVQLMTIFVEEYTPLPLAG